MFDIILKAAAGVVVSSATAASNSWFNLHNRAGLFLEVHRANLDRSNQYYSEAQQSGWASIMNINVLLKDNIHAVAEIPIAGATFDWSYGENGGAGHTSDATVGNPYLGFAWSNPGNSWIFELAVMMPVIPGRESIPIGQIDAMFVDKLEAFEPKTFGLELGLGRRDVGWDGFVFRSMARGILQDGISFDIELDAAREFRRAFFQVSYVGRWRAVTTETHTTYAEDSYKSDKFASQLMFAAGPRTDKLEAGISMIVPLEEFVPYAPSVVWGVNLRCFFEPMPAGESGLE